MNTSDNEFLKQKLLGSNQGYYVKSEGTLQEQIKCINNRKHAVYATKRVIEICER